MPKEVWNLQDLADKIDWEGGIGSALYYFGRDLHTENERFNELWKVAYDSITGLEDLLPEVSSEE